MKLIVRADDLGFTDAVNHGIHKAIKDGIVTSTGLMTNMSEAENGFNLVKKYNHISIGQHTNICVGKPCSDPKKIPSMVDEYGNFHSSKEFRIAYKEGREIITFEDAVVEVQAQLDRFREITGKHPAYFEGHAIQSKHFEKALEYVADKNNLLYVPFGVDIIPKINCKMAKFPKFSVDNLYDPFNYILNDEGEILNSDLALIVAHPGYVDQNLLELSSFNMIRPLEVKALISDEIKNWVKHNNIELVNFNGFKN